MTYFDEIKMFIQRRTEVLQRREEKTRKLIKSTRQESANNIIRLLRKPCSLDLDYIN